MYAHHTDLVSHADTQIVSPFPMFNNHYTLLGASFNSFMWLLRTFSYYHILIEFDLFCNSDMMHTLVTGNTHTKVYLNHSKGAAKIHINILKFSSSFI